MGESGKGIGPKSTDMVSSKDWKYSMKIQRRVVQYAMRLYDCRYTCSTKRRSADEQGSIRGSLDSLIDILSRVI